MAYIGKSPATAALTSSDVTDGIITTAKIADAGITNAKLNADIISGDTALGAAPADTDEFLVSDAGVLKRMDYSHIKGGGKIVQVTQGTKVDTQTISSNSPTFAAFDLVATITPTSTSNKILIFSGATFSTQHTWRTFWKMMVDVAGGGYNNLPFIGATAGSRVPCHYYDGTNHNGGGDTVGFTYLHSPSTTSALSYKWYTCIESTGGTSYINRTHTDTDNTSYGRGASSIILFEVEG